MISYVISYVLTVNGPDSDAPLHESAVNVRDERHRHCIRPHRKLCELKCNGSVRFTCIYPFSPRVSLQLEPIVLMPRQSRIGHQLPQDLF